MFIFGYWHSNWNSLNAAHKTTLVSLKLGVPFTFPERPLVRLCCITSAALSVSWPENFVLASFFLLVFFFIIISELL